MIKDGDAAIIFGCSFTDSNDDDALLIHTAVEHKDIVLKLFESIPHTIALHTIVDKYTGDNSVMQKYVVFNTITYSIVAILTQRKFIYNDKSTEINWTGMVPANSFSTHIIELLKQKYPNIQISGPLNFHKLDVYDIENPKKIVDEDIKKIQEPYELQVLPTLFKTVSELVQQVVSFMSMAGCYVLANPLEKLSSIDPTISKVCVTHSVYVPSFDNCHIMTIKTYSEAILNNSGETVGIKKENVSISMDNEVFEKSEELQCFTTILFNTIKTMIS